jgi:solute carrier family 35 (UDP-galactose transporter), member B1
MLLSVIVYNHQLTLGQWLGAAIVFAGISVEAVVKRKGLRYISLSAKFYPDLFADVHAKRIVQEKEKAKIKSL